MDLTLKSSIFSLDSMKSIGDVNILSINLVKVISKSVICIFQISNFISESIAINTAVIQFNSGMVELVVKISDGWVKSINLTKKGSIRLF